MHKKAEKGMKRKRESAGSGMGMKEQNKITCELWSSIKNYFKKFKVTDFLMVWQKICDQTHSYTADGNANWYNYFSSERITENTVGQVDYFS